MVDQPIEAVIFDFDGTIIDTESSEYETVKAEFGLHGVDFELAAFLEGVGRADGRHWTDILQDRIGRRDDIEEIKERRRLAHHDLITRTPIRPGVEELMARAETGGRRLAVASSSPLSWVRDHLTDRGLYDRFGYVATRDIVAKAKPWPDVFLAASTGLGVAPDRCLVVEDSHHGVAAAKAAGMTCIAVPNPVTASSDFQAADLILDSLADLPFERFGLDG